MNISRLTERYISERVSIKDCLRQGLINYSELARQICSSYRIEKFDAVLIACRRYATKLRKQQGHEQAVRELIQGARLRVRNRMMVAIVEKPRSMERFFSLQQRIRKRGDDCNLIEGEQVVTLVTNSDNRTQIDQEFGSRVRKYNDGLVQVTMVFDRRIETTPGVVSCIYGLLAEHHLNILEEMSCWTDVMLILEERDLPAAMKALSIDSQ